MRGIVCKAAVDEDHAAAIRQRDESSFSACRYGHAYWVEIPKKEPAAFLFFDSSCGGSMLCHAGCSFNEHQLDALAGTCIQLTSVT